MFNFLLGVVIGWLAGSWYSNAVRRGDLQVGALRRRASVALAESARLVDESRRELQNAVESGTGRAEHSRRRPPHSDQSEEQPRND